MAVWTESVVVGDSDEGDRFGNSVALAADTALVGAERDENPNRENGGSAYIFDIEWPSRSADILSHVRTSTSITVNETAHSSDQ